MFSRFCVLFVAMWPVEKIVASSGNQRLSVLSTRMRIFVGTLLRNNAS